jgi:hypothetical protein
MKKWLYYFVFGVHSCMFANYTITFVNTTLVAVHIDFHMSDQSIVSKVIPAGKSYELKNFADKFLENVSCTSAEKDVNGNLYGNLDQKFEKLFSDQIYEIGLKDVPAHTVAATEMTEAFQMPATQAFTCLIKTDASTKAQDHHATEQDQALLQPAAQSNIVQVDDKKNQIPVQQGQGLPKENSDHVGIVTK